MVETMEVDAMEVVDGGVDDRRDGGSGGGVDGGGDDGLETMEAMDVEAM